MENLFNNEGENPNLVALRINQFFDQQTEKLRAGNMTEEEFSDLMNPQSYNPVLVKSLVGDKARHAELDAWSTRADQLRSEREKIELAQKMVEKRIPSKEELIKKMSREEFEHFEKSLI